MTIGLQRSSRRFLSVLLAFTFAVAPIAPVVADDEEVESVAAIESEEAEFEAAHSTDCQGVVWIDLPRPGENITVPTSQVAGWALDANETFASGVDAIRVTLGRPGAPGALELAATGTGVPRPDVDAHWQRADLRAGYSALVDWFRLPAGPQTIFVNGRTHCGWVEASVNVNIAAPPPAPPVSLSINDVRRSEGNSGDRDFDFTVTLSGPSTQTVTVNYRTEESSAREGSDYQGTSGTVTFSPGETSKSIRVRVFGDTSREGDETFRVILSNAVNASISDSEGIGTIDDDDQFLDGFGDVTIDSATCNEGSTCTFSVRRFGDTGVSRSFSWFTENISATGGSSCGTTGVDFAPTSGSVFFSSNDTIEDISIQACSDGVGNEGSETFRVRISGRTATGTILDTGVGGGTIFFSGSTTPSCARATGAACLFTVTQSGGTATATVSYTVAPTGGATAGTSCIGAGVDFFPTTGTSSSTGTVLVSAGSSNSISITTCATGTGAGEGFTVTLTGTTSGTIVSPSVATGTIT